jgi:hypothetical protein
MRRRLPIKAVSQISLDPQPQGTRAVYLVEARDESEAREVSNLFGDLEPELRIRQLSSGKLVTYVVKASQDQQDALGELELALKRNFGFVILHRSFDSLIYKIVEELCVDTGSRLISVPRCDICGKIEPFPDTVVSLADQVGETIVSGSYCGSCTAASSARSNKEFLLSLLQADTRDFSAIQDVQLVRARSRKSIKFRIQCRTEHGCVANG